MEDVKSFYCIHSGEYRKCNIIKILRTKFTQYLGIYYFFLFSQFFFCFVKRKNTIIKLPLISAFLSNLSQISDPQKMCSISTILHPIFSLYINLYLFNGSVTDPLIYNNKFKSGKSIQEYGL